MLKLTGPVQFTDRTVNNIRLDIKHMPSNHLNWATMNVWINKIEHVPGTGNYDAQWLKPDEKSLLLHYQVACV